LGIVFSVREVHSWPLIRAARRVNRGVGWIKKSRQTGSRAVYLKRVRRFLGITARSASI
jgi:hypothetical protein